MDERGNLLKIIALQLNHPVNENTVCDIKAEDWKSLITFAQNHGLLPYVALYAQALPPEKSPDEKLSNYLFSALAQETARSANQLDVAAEMQGAMEQNGVYNLAVKGAVTKLRYDNEVLRSMGDIDILYQPGQHRLFKKTMADLGYTDFQEGRKNDTYSRPPFITVEAHRELVESYSNYADYYKNIWSMARPKPGMQYTYEMTLEDEFIFNIVHLAEHFKEGGAGIRFIIDVFVYSRREMNRAYVEKELTNLGLNEFYHHMVELSDYWFAGGRTSDLTEKLSDFVLSGGVFGDKENWAALAVQEGKFKHFVKVCFPGYKSMRSMFPWLEGRGILLPYAWGLRGVRALRYRKDNVQVQMNRLRTGDTEKAKALRQFYHDCGLE